MWRREEGGGRGGGISGPGEESGFEKSQEQVGVVGKRNWETKRRSVGGQL